MLSLKPQRNGFFAYIGNQEFWLVWYPLHPNDFPAGRRIYRDQSGRRRFWGRCLRVGRYKVLVGTYAATGMIESEP